MRTRQDPEQMKTWLSRRERHGWSWVELSRRSGLPVWKLHWWRRRFDRPPERSGGFVAVDVLSSSPAVPIEVVTRSGDRVRVPFDFDEQHLLRLVRVLHALDAGW